MYSLVEFSSPETPKFKDDYYYSILFCFKQQYITLFLEVYFETMVLYY